MLISLINVAIIKGEKECRLKMLVPGHVVSNVMGRGRANVDTIRKISEASVEISDNKSSCGDRYDQDYFPGKRKRGKDYKKEHAGTQAKGFQLLRKFRIHFKGGFENAEVGGDPKYTQIGITAAKIRNSKF
ncbi:auxin transport protein BIG [Tanacetum coccineum]